MIRAFKLEWLKVRHYRLFWILFGLYLIAQLIITSSGVFLLEWLAREGIDFDGIDPTIVPIYDFPDIWLNTTWLASFVKFLLAFIVIVSVNNELSYNTLRQNIIDGVSKKEFLLSKFTLILFLSAVCTLTLFTSGLITGSVYSHVYEVKYIMQELDSLLAYFLQLVAYCLLAFCFALVIKKAGFAIISLFLYSLVFEPILTLMMEFKEEINKFTSHLTKFFPVHAIEKLTGKVWESPFARYAFREIKTDLFWYEWIIAIGWIGLFSLFIIYLLNKKDLKA